MWGVMAVSWAMWCCTEESICEWPQPKGEEQAMIAKVLATTPKVVKQRSLHGFTWLWAETHTKDEKEDQNSCLLASLVAQWLRIHLPMQGTQVRALVRENPTCRGATKPAHHNYWSWAVEPMSHNYWAHVPQLLKPARLEPVLCNKRSHGNEKPTHRNKE